jgi:hypothetical protein
MRDAIDLALVLGLIANCRYPKLFKVLDKLLKIYTDEMKNPSSVFYIKDKMTKEASAMTPKERHNAIPVAFNILMGIATRYIEMTKEKSNYNTEKKELYWKITMLLVSYKRFDICRIGEAINFEKIVDKKLKETEII